MAKEIRIPKETWYETAHSTGVRVYFDRPIFGFNWRQGDRYHPVLTACSGIAFNPGGIDNLSFDSETKLFKLDWRTVEQCEAVNSVTIKHVPKSKYRSFHYLTLKDVFARYPNLSMEMKKGLLEQAKREVEETIEEGGEQSES